jgi:hypothetical protein
MKSLTITDSNCRLHTDNRPVMDTGLKPALIDAVCSLELGLTQQGQGAIQTART